ncbi:hypothetical protein TrRE_jg2454 [Triparma retinervis]|jgi:cytochrome-b5 reductase|uniref:Cytochrome b5 heme-binding domain-containing protein n=1 Tax=Triparma retinervis TaxID=2557542 RepID=A0A9W7E284_9STRA|nr:hypothetical protein TrRE_jg2454 [Triparma retinervis]
MPPPKSKSSLASNPKLQPGRKTAVNPRQKFRLAPGFGMMDWVRLKQASSDLAHLKGSPQRASITLEEVARHCTLHDCWIVLRGAVYNIGPYLAYHPGGKDIIMKFKGRDCTKEFDKYHRWVNIEGLVGVLKVGYLAK